MTRRSTMLALALVGFACGGRRGLPPEVPPIVKGPDGKQYHLVEKGPYKAFYDLWGHLQRIEYDSNGDGRPDRIAHHDGSKTPHLIDVDEDLDGTMDRWEDYDGAGRLLKVGVSRRGRGPDLWTYPGAGDVPARRDYDEDGDARVDRVEILEGGSVARVELDSDRNGRTDRWQQWKNGRLVSEELDTNGDGQPDRRLRYGGGGSLQGLERLAHD